ncbi:uncharacterized protein LOC132740865 [Ruditapes philippinarum]|uniref:uncharacterized protein LOC132740865 n=1 Tax=Ruditapes philippinarum TaxID=129788 RepID=UPI00295B2BB6|nr:uncharacterized protein LOC132740865 [Ruditapes philippinarum]
MSSLSWKTVLQENCDFQQIALVIDVMLTIPSTSVKCETAFSQLKLLKTCRRSKLGTSVLNDLMIVKLQSPSIANFDPEDAIEKWLAASVMGRRTTYIRRPKSTPVTTTVVTDSEALSENNATDTEEIVPVPSYDIDTAESRPSVSTYSIDMLCDKDSDYDDDDFDHESECFDFQTESINFDKLMFYLRE